jgi:hypothetical protein
VRGRLNALTISTRALGYAHGAVLASQLKPVTPPDTLKGAIASCRLFVEHPDRAHDRIFLARHGVVIGEIAGAFLSRQGQTGIGRHSI